MSNENKEEFFWKEWRDILLVEFESRMAAVGVKGQGIVPSRKTFTAIFIQLKSFSVPAADILPEAIRTIRENDAPQSGISLSAKEYDSISMLGHRIGMVDNSANLKQYLLDVRAVLKPEGQILLTSLDIHAVSEPGYRLYPCLSSRQFQQANLIGPFFNMIRIKADNLKNQAVAANWHCEFICRQDDSNYLARLNLAE